MRLISDLLQYLHNLNPGFMKKTFAVLSTFLSLLFFIQPANAAGWGEIDSPTSQILLSVDVEDDTLIAVGENGVIIYSDDAGTTWTRGTSGVSVQLSDVVAISETKAVAVGNDGVILRSTDGGATWTQITSTGLTQSYDLNAVAMPSSSIGYAVGESGIGLKTTDGGVTWTEMTDLSDSTSQNLTNVMATSTTTLWVCGENGAIFKSTDGGSNWTGQSAWVYEDLTSIRFSGSSTGWAVGANRAFLKTSDGGTTWTQETISNLASEETIYDVSFSGDDGILTSSAGKLLETDDGGDSWTSVSASRSVVLRDIIRLSSTEWWGVGNGGAIFRYDATSPSKPTSFDVTGDNDAIQDSTPKFTWTAADENETDIDTYYFKVDSESYERLGNVTSHTWDDALENGDHTAYLYAVDLGGNASSVASVEFTMDADSTDEDAPSVGSITPTTAVNGETVTFSVKLSDDGSLESCDLFVDGEEEKSMTVKRDIAYTTLSFDTNGTYAMYARCSDDEGNKTTGTEKNLTVSTGSTHVSPGSIIKTGCTGDVYPNDPCTAVYYYGVDGKRHAFPSEQIFNTWFDDFDDLVILSSSAMSDISLGRNVTVAPDDQLIKFSTNTVYAVSYGGYLRPIANAEIAEAIYGEDWVSLIDVIDDVFYGNYRIGATIESSTDFSPDAAASATSTIDKTF